MDSRMLQSDPPLFSHHLPPAPSDTPKKRSLSDSTPSLDPSPKFIEGPRRTRDDDSLMATPTRAPRRVDLSARGLYLQMSPRESSFSILGPGAGLGIQTSQLDQIDNYGSPSSVLPRHSRGIDFARAATNLHHSTLAEQQSPDSSPVITQRSMFPPSRRGSTYAGSVDSPRVNSVSTWSWNMPGNGGGGEKSSILRSLSSAIPMSSEGSSNSSDDDDTLMENDEMDQDSVIGTPQIHKMEDVNNATPYEANRWPSEQTSNNNVQSPVPGSFANYRRTIFGKRHTRNHRDHPYQRNRTSSPEPSSVSMPSNLHNSNLFGQEPVMRRPSSRRESLSLGIGMNLHITSSNEEPEEMPFGKTAATPGVVRRPVTRRSNLLPKTKNFARIRAALQEENSPIDSEVRRESEVVRQVRVNDVGLKDRTSTTPSSPDITPSVRNMSNDGSEMSDIEAFGLKGGLGSGAISDLRRGSFGIWQHSRNRSQTPPPELLNRHRSSSGVSEDMNADSISISTPPSSIWMPLATMPDPMTSLPSIEPSFIAPFQPPNLPTAAEMSRKINKRRRDDDFDVNSFKRRAVSPGMSVHSSPVLGQSPVSTTGNWPARQSREGSTPGSNEEKSQGNGSATGHATPSLGPKRVGLQGMTDTSETLMKMSID